MFVASWFSWRGLQFAAILVVVVLMPIFVVLCHSILLFDPRREHSFVPTAYFHRRLRAAAVKDGASSAPPKACP
jgi:hypothetical protein